MFIVQLLHQMVDIVDSDYVILSQYIGFFVKFNNILYFNPEIHVLKKCPWSGFENACLI